MFNTAPDKISVFDQFYDSETTFEHPFKATFKGKTALVGFWTDGHKGIHEVLVPPNILFDSDSIAGHHGPRP